MTTASQQPAAGRVTILLSTHNGAQWLDAQLRSIVAQRYNDWQLTIADDGSSDGTAEILRRWSDHEPRITSVTYRSTGDRLGPTASYLDLLARVDTPWWAFSDQDDVWFADRLDIGLRVVSRLATDRPAVVCTDAVVTAADLSVRRASAMRHRGRLPAGVVPPTAIALQNRAIGMTMTGNRSAARLATSRPELVGSAAMHDWWVALITAASGSLVYVDCPTVWYRQHDHNVTGIERNLGARSARFRRQSLASRTTTIVHLAARQAHAARQVVGSIWPPALNRLAELDTVACPSVFELVALSRRRVRLASTIGEALMILGGRRPSIGRGGRSTP